MSRLTRDGTAEPSSRDQKILRHERGHGNFHFFCSADHVQNFQPYPVDPYSAICVTIHTWALQLHLILIAMQGHQHMQKRKTKKALVSVSLILDIPYKLSYISFCCLHWRYGYSNRCYIILYHIILYHNILYILYYKYIISDHVRSYQPGCVLP